MNGRKKDCVASFTLPLDDQTDYDGAQITGVPELLQCGSPGSILSMGSEATEQFE